MLFRRFFVAKKDNTVILEQTIEGIKPWDFLKSYF